MRLKKIENFGNTYILSGDEIEKFETLSELFEEEENFMLSLKTDYDLEVREDLLILFVQMYLLRFAIPYFQLMNHGFPNRLNSIFLKKVLYFCLVGRFVDDLVDADSKMFKTYESILLYQKYYSRLTKILSETEKDRFDQYLFESTKYKSPTLEGVIYFDDIKTDVYNRIRYFFGEAENSRELEQQRLQTYTGVLLGGLDLNDLIADGYNRNSSTAISNYIYHKYYNDEGKLLLDQKLFDFYTAINLVFEKEAGNLMDYCNANKLFYTANILRIIL